MNKPMPDSGGRRLQARTANHYDSYPFDFLTAEDEAWIEEIQPRPFRGFVRLRLSEKDRVAETGESLFLRKLVLGIQAQASGRTQARLLMPDGAPIRPAALVATQQGVATTVHNDFTPLSGSLLFSLRKLRENIRPCGAIGDYRPSRSLSLADSGSCSGPVTVDSRRR